MQLNLSHWKTLLLLLPFITGLLFTSVSIAPKSLHNSLTVIGNYLVIIGIIIIAACQALILTGFITAIDKKSTLIKINAWIPVSFLTLYLLFLIFRSLTAKPTLVAAVHSQSGPIRQADVHGLNLAVELFLIYTVVNFLFINNNYVYRQIKSITDKIKQAELTTNYSKPMQTIVRTCLYCFGSFILLTAILDAISYLTLNK